MTTGTLKGFTASDLVAVRLGLQAALCFYDERPCAAGNIARVQGLIRDVDALLVHVAPGREEVGFNMPAADETPPVLVLVSNARH